MEEILIPSRTPCMINDAVIPDNIMCDRLSARWTFLQRGLNLSQMSAPFHNLGHREKDNRSLHTDVLAFGKA